jgi:WW domain-binding protein 4
VPRKPPPKPSDPYANYSTAASLGYTDPDAERFTAETERRRTQGVAGDWEVITSSSTTSAEASESTVTLKRDAEIAIDEEDGRQFKLRKKTLNVGLDEIYDPGIIPVKLKKKERSPLPEVPSLHTQTQRWAPVQKELTSGVTAEERVGQASTEGGDLAARPPVKVEDELSTTMDMPASIDDSAWPFSDQNSSAVIVTTKPEKLEVPSLSSADSSGSMFRKRKLRHSRDKGRI